jgi:hypothetical protein
MAKGRRDYTWGFWDEAASGARYSESFTDKNEIFVSHGEDQIIYSVVIPSGIRLIVNNMIVSTTSMYRNEVTIQRNADIIALVRFSDNYEFNFSSPNPLIFNEGETLIVAVGNHDVVDALFDFTIVGTLQDISQ